jgi:molybdopterin converting factor small subunit
MKIKIEILGLLHIPGFKNNSYVEISESSTIAELYSELKIMRDHQKFITPFINGVEVKKGAQIKDGDTVKFFLPTGGG